MSKKILITDTTLRDAHQSLLATRLKIDDIVPVLDKLDDLGYRSLEVWGGATFDTCMRYLNEDPWERLRVIKRHLKKTPVQMLLRGQNLVGYRHYADDVVKAFIEKAIENGVDVFRVFDALNDLRNMASSFQAIKKGGAHLQGTMAYTISPVHNIAYYVDLAGQMAEMGADSLCIKDMAGILAPFDAYELVKTLKKKIGLPVYLHCHYTSGMASMSYLKAVEAGVDGLDCAISPLGNATSQPAVEAIVASLQGTAYDTELDLSQLAIVADYFKDIKGNYQEYDRQENQIDPKVLLYQIPGGMISNFVNQLKEQNALDKMAEVLAEVPKVRADFGYPPLVTPTSQIIGTQAVLNIMAGERYQIVSNETKNYLKGAYGTPPGKINDKIRAQVTDGSLFNYSRPADFIKPQIKKAKKEIAYYLEKEEDVLTYIMFPQVAKIFFERRMTDRTKIDQSLTGSEEKVDYYPV